MPSFKVQQKRARRSRLSKAKRKAHNIRQVRRREEEACRQLPAALAGGLRQLACQVQSLPNTCPVRRLPGLFWGLYREGPE